MKVSSLLLAAASLLAAGPSFAAGTVTPFSLAWANGAQDAVYKMADHPNGIFVLEAFQNFCEYCHANAANVDEVYQKYQSNPRVQVLDLDEDSDQGEIQSWIDQMHPAYPVIVDDNSQVFNQLGGDGGIPETAVLDCKGNIVYFTEGEWDDQAKQGVTDAIDQLAGQTCTAN
jgi:peroxiredoxin